MSDSAIRISEPHTMRLRAVSEEASSSRAEGVAEPTPEPNVDACFKVLSSIQEQVRFADGKTGFLFGINALMFGFAASALAPLKAFWWTHPSHPLAVIASVNLAAFVLLAAAAVFTLIWMVVSRFRGLNASSHLFFGHIVQSFGNDQPRYAAEVLRMSDMDWSREICHQIVSVSHIAMIKHGLVRRAGWLTIAAFCCWLLAVFSTTLLPVTI